MQRQSLFAIATTMLVLAIPAVSQTFADGQWSGSIQCKLDVEQPGYSRHEIQTWTLTGQPPRNEGMWIHPATWAYAGGGHIAQAQGPRMVNIQWNINVPPSDASLAMFVRASDKKFIIRLGYSPRPLYDAVSGMRQITLNGTPQPPGRVNFPVSAWQWPWIEATAGTNVSGSMSIQAESLGGDLAQPGGPPTAVCKYQFSRAGASPDLTPASQNCSQSAAKISQTFDTMEGDIAKRYEALIQQTKDSTQATALSTQEKNLISRLET